MIRKILGVGVSLFFSLTAYATAWQIVPDKSHLTFAATQNNSPLTGEFKTFSGDIQFDPDNLKTSSVNVVVNLGSVTTSYKEVADTLQTAEWFDVKNFPKAIFKANSFTHTEGKTYQADGTLMIHGKTVPVVLTFSLDEYTPTNAHVKGTANLKRTALGVGTGEWASTDNVKDDVQVNFDLTATKK